MRLEEMGGTVVMLDRRTGPCEWCGDPAETTGPVLRCDRCTWAWRRWLHLEAAGYGIVCDNRTPGGMTITTPGAYGNHDLAVHPAEVLELGNRAAYHNRAH